MSVIKKVLLISFEFPPKVGGAGSVGLDYAKFLSHCGHDVNVITLQSNGDVLEQGFKVISVKSPRKIQSLFIYYRFLAIYNESYDAIILNDAGASLVGSLFFSKQVQSKSIVFLHGTEDRKLINNSAFLYSSLKVKEKYLRLMENCHSIIAVSSHLKAKFIKASGLDSLSDKINVVKNNVSNFSQDCTNANHIRAREHFDKNSIILLTASRLVKGKGYLRMLNLFNQIVEVEPRYKWIIAGDGEFKQVIISQIESLGLSNHVKLVGALDKKQLFSYYKSVDLFWMLSDFDEGYGLVYMEAAINGCPVMGNNRGGVKEVITDEIGYLVNSDSEVIDILKNKKFLSLNNDRIESIAKELNRDERWKILHLLEI